MKRICLIGGGNITNLRHIPGLQHTGRAEVIGVIGAEPSAVTRTAQRVRTPNSWVVDPARPFGEGKATLSGQVFSGQAISMGNPHLACLTEGDVDSLDLTRAPEFDAGLFPEGVNVEVINVLEPAAHIRLRVYERGVGETRSCGTGACAAAYAALVTEGASEGTVQVDHGTDGGTTVTLALPRVEGH